MGTNVQRGGYSEEGRGHIETEVQGLTDITSTIHYCACEILEFIFLNVSNILFCLISVYYKC